MTFFIGLDRLNQPIHLAGTAERGSRAFTSSPTGYRALLKWAGEVAGAEPVEFLLAGTGRYASALVAWLQGQGQDVRFTPLAVAI